MAEGEDSRPFLVLKQNAEDFKAVFDRDITTLLDTLDSRITDLLRNPESLCNSAGGGAKRLNAHMEFSKAKLDIFVTLKDKVVDMAEQWADHLSEIRDTFVENVEIFLAGTKLEVKENVSSPAGSRKSLSLKERKKQQSPPSSLYPKLPDIAKSIPVLNNLLPKNNLHDSMSEPQDVDSSPLLKPIRKQSALSEADTTGPGRRKNSVRFAGVENTENVEMVQEEESSDSEVEIVEAPVVVKKRRGRPAASAAQTSLRKAVVIKALQNEVLEAEEKLIEESPSRSGRGSRRGPATPSSAKKAITPVVQPKTQLETSSDSSISGEESSAAEAKPRTRRGAQVKADEPVTPRSVGKASRASKMSVTEEVITPVKDTPGRRGRRAAASAEPVFVVTPPKPTEVSPKTKNFPHGLDLTEDLEVFSPVVNLTRSAPRRKTVILQDLGFTPEVPKSKSKRKTIGGDLSGTPSKRLKMSGRNSLAPQEMEVEESDDSDHLEGDNSTATGNYTPWIPLSDVGAGVPTEPGIYELKVSQAKKPAYIGGCESLRQKLTLHRLRHGSGHKHLDKFVERNVANLLVRYERTESLAAAKVLEKARVAAFTAVHNTTPAYN